MYGTVSKSPISLLFAGILEAPGQSACSLRPVLLRHIVDTLFWEDGRAPTCIRMPQSASRG